MPRRRAGIKIFCALEIIAENIGEHRPNFSLMAGLDPAIQTAVPSALDHRVAPRADPLAPVRYEGKFIR
jgi:hypothetical protein